MQKLNKIGEMSLGKMYSALYVGLSIIISVLAILFSLVQGGIIETIIGSVLLVIGAGIGGFVMGIITAYIYNFYAEKFGGVEIEIK